MDCMTFVFNDCDPASRDPFLQLVADLDELLIQSTGDDERGNLHRTQCRPHRLHGSRSKPAKCRSQAYGSVLEPVFLRVVVDVTEDRLGQPFVKECAQTDALDPIGQGEVAVEPSASSSFVLDAGSPGDQYEFGDTLRMVERRAQAKASSHGVTDIAPGSDRLDDSASCFDKGWNSQIRKTVAWEIDQLELRVLHAVHDRFPGSARLREAVNQPDRRSRSDLVEMQHPIRIARHEC